MGRGGGRQRERERERERNTIWETPALCKKQVPCLVNESCSKPGVSWQVMEANGSSRETRIAKNPTKSRLSHNVAETQDCLATDISSYL